MLNGDTDVKAPRELTPAFYGCYDWHSSVHGHWLLARVARLTESAVCRPRAGGARQEHHPGEHRRGGPLPEWSGPRLFERPYRLAWLLQLDGELHEWAAERPADSDVRRWAAALEPLTSAATSRIADWLPKLTAPIRVGEHSQTAFSFGLMLDWARKRGEKTLESLLCPDLAISTEGSRVPACLRTVRRRFPVALRGGGRPDAAGAAAGGNHALAARLPAVVAGTVEATGLRRRGDRPHRS